MDGCLRYKKRHEVTNEQRELWPGLRPTKHTHCGFPLTRGHITGVLTQSILGKGGSVGIPSFGRLTCD